MCRRGVRLTATVTVRRHMAWVLRASVVALACLLCCGGEGIGGARASAQADEYDYVVNVAVNYNYSSLDVPPCAGCTGASADNTALSQLQLSTTSYLYDPGGAPPSSYVSAGGYATQTSVAGMPAQTSTDYACSYQTDAIQPVLAAASLVVSQRDVTFSYNAVPEDLSHRDAHQRCSGTDKTVEYVPRVPLCYDDNGGDHCASGLESKRLRGAQSKAFQGKLRISKRAVPLVDHRRSFAATLTGTRRLPPAVPGGTPGSARASLKVKTFIDWFRVKRRSHPTHASEQIDEDELQRMRWDIGPPPTDQAAFVPILPDGGPLSTNVTSISGAVVMTGHVAVRRLRPALLPLTLTAAGRALFSSSHPATSVRATITFKPSGASTVTRLTLPFVIPAST